LVCGGDVPGWTPGESTPIRFDPAYRQELKRKLPAPIAHSISECRDLLHNRALTNWLAEKSTQQKWDIVWERSCRLHWAGLRIAERLGIPYVLEWKDHLIPDSPSVFRNLALRIERLKEEKASTIVVESSILKTVLAQQVAGPKDIIVAENAVDANVFSSFAEGRQRFRALWNIKGDEIVVGYMGSYAFYHDCTTLVRAAKVAVDRGQTKMRFIMIGSKGQQYAESEALARQEGLLGSVLTMLPKVPQADAPAALCAFDIAVLPGSTDIICPIKIMEFMASETVAVVPDYQCNRDVLADGVTGVLFAPGNAEDLAAKLISLAEQPSWRRELGQRARLAAIERFSWEQTWGKALKEAVHRHSHICIDQCGC
jgi:glycosyltransferase involved in cell wall biosynthesis